MIRSTLCLAKSASFGSFGVKIPEPIVSSSRLFVQLYQFNQYPIVKLEKHVGFVVPKSIDIKKITHVAEQVFEIKDSSIRTFYQAALSEDHVEHFEFKLGGKYLGTRLNGPKDFLVNTLKDEEVAEIINTLYRDHPKEIRSIARCFHRDEAYVNKHTFEDILFSNSYMVKSFFAHPKINFLKHIDPTGDYILYQKSSR